MIIVKAIRDDHQVLTETTKRSKAYWGFSKEQLEAWSHLLTITPEYIETKNVYKLVIDDKIIGYYAFFNDGEERARLDNLFILPEYIGKGYGRLLMIDFLNRVGAVYKKVILDSEPKAEKFYSKFGFKTVGQIETSIKDRYLQVMELELSQNQ